MALPLSSGADLELWGTEGQLNSKIVLSSGKKSPSNASANMWAW